MYSLSVRFLKENVEKHIFVAGLVERGRALVEQILFFSKKAIFKWPDFKSFTYFFIDFNVLPLGFGCGFIEWAQRTKGPWFDDC